MGGWKKNQNRGCGVSIPKQLCKVSFSMLYEPYFLYSKLMLNRWWFLEHWTCICYKTRNYWHYNIDWSQLSFFKRCSLPIVNPKTGEKKGEEPLKTLRRYNWNSKSSYALKKSMLLNSMFSFPLLNFLKNERWLVEHICGWQFPTVFTLSFDMWWSLHEISKSTKPYGIFNLFFQLIPE